MPNSLNALLQNENVTIQFNLFNSIQFKFTLFFTNAIKKRSYYIFQRNNDSYLVSVEFTSLKLSMPN